MPASPLQATRVLSLCVSLCAYVCICSLWCVCAPSCFIRVFVWVWGFNEALLTQHISWGNGRLRGKAARVLHEHAAKRFPRFHPATLQQREQASPRFASPIPIIPLLLDRLMLVRSFRPLPYLPAHVQARTSAHDLSKFDWRAQPSVAGRIVDISRGRINALPVWLHNCVFMLLWRRRRLEPEPEASCVSLNAIAQ